MAFHAIYIAPALSARNRDRAVEVGPPRVAASASYPDLLTLAGFGEINEVDLTDQYRTTAAAWAHECARSAEQLKEISGIEEYQQSQQDREEALAAIDSGLLKRSLFTAQAD
jgi:hypothetical protein